MREISITSRSPPRDDALGHARLRLLEPADGVDEVVALPLGELVRLEEALELLRLLPVQVILEGRHHLFDLLVFLVIAAVRAMRLVFNLSDG